VEHLATRLAEIPGVVAVTLGGSRATGDATPESDWDFGLYYRGTLDSDDVRALGWKGTVFAPGEWGELINGGAWLEVDGTKVDLIYRDLEQVLHWTTEAEAGRFRVGREVGYVAGLPTYVLTAELAIGQVLQGVLPQPAYPEVLRTTAPPFWRNLAAGALHYAAYTAKRGERVACLANLTQAVLSTGHARLAAAGQWVLNEKLIVQRADLVAARERLADATDLLALVNDVGALLDAPDSSSPWDS
jgi:hypothetical protein